MAHAAPATGGRVASSSEAALAPRRADPAAVLGVLTTSASDACAPGTKGAAGGVCSAPRTVAKLGEFIVATGAAKGAGRAGSAPGAFRGKAPRDVVAAAAAALGCPDEACAVTHPNFINYVVKTEGKGEANELVREAATRFKPKGPRDSTALLSNFDIDAVLEQWAAEFSEPGNAFYNFSFAMMDFEKTGDHLARVDPCDIIDGQAVQSLGAAGKARRPCNTFACVLNTDYSSGRGKHWVAVFGDCRGDGPWSVEYFNSAGNPPPREVVKWAEETAARLKLCRVRAGSSAPVEATYLTNTRHQDGNTECGLYALYFIRRRLEGAPPDEFMREAGRIPDADMTEFRKHVFRS
jgi:hypothetical protein